VKNPQEAIQLGKALKSAGRLSEAAGSFRAAVELSPDNVEAVTFLGLTLAQMGAAAPAVTAFERAVQLRFDLAETHCNLGNALCDTGQWEAAIAALRQAIAINPRMAGAHSNLGNAFHGIGDLDGAVASYRKALELEPSSVMFLNNLAVALREKRQFAESMECCRAALRIQPDDPQSHNNLGSALACMGELDQAEAEYGKVLRLQPDRLATWTDLGHVAYFKGELDRAVEIYRRVLQRKPDDAQAHWSLALILLSRGQYEEGWQHYEWRWRVKELRMRCRTEIPPWDGGELRGKTILLHNEQGFGDTIQFVRYVPLVGARGGKIVLACQRELFSLLENLPHIQRCVPNDDPAAAAGCDVCAPLLGLPALLGTRADTIPADAPYLSASAARVDHWRGRLAGEKRRKIGIAWAGRPTHANDRNRSMRPDNLAALAEVRNVAWINLQKPDAARESATAPLELIDWTAELTDFADTAGLIANLDLVICVDTAVAHLAGAMGKPVWVLLPFVADWRWMLNRQDSPWYPTLRLFRQERIADWRAPLARIAEALK
jgi:tetratricopeptide (TPR) repeat protein